jgi:acylphosphatase
MARTAFLITVVGAVQGVGFRAFVRRKARDIGLEGWVRNRRDNSVEILAIGATDAIDRLIEACNEGPPLAKVQQVSLRGAEDDGSQGFTERETA